MIKYACKKKDKSTSTDLSGISKRHKTSIYAGSEEKIDIKANIFWCKCCKVPLINPVCGLCSSKAKEMADDIRPVFPEERLLLEIITKEPFLYLKSPVWKDAENIYYVNGKQILFPHQSIPQLCVEETRDQYLELSRKNTYTYFHHQMEQFTKANQDRYGMLEKETSLYIRSLAKPYGSQNVFVIFNGGKSTTAAADLTRRALNHQQLTYVFEDVLPEFPYTLKYIKKFQSQNPDVPVVFPRNLCRYKNDILTVGGIRKSESLAKGMSTSLQKEVTFGKQKIVFPVIDWLDFDVWLYLMTRKIDFNKAYRLGYRSAGIRRCKSNSEWSAFLSAIHIHMPEQIKNSYKEGLTFLGHL